MLGSSGAGPEIQAHLAGTHPTPLFATAATTATDGERNPGLRYPPP